MSKDSGRYDPNDFNHDGKTDWKDYVEYEFNEDWIRNRQSKNDGSDEGCCYLILIGIAVFFVLGILSIIF